jgi:hypothetical protein
MKDYEDIAARADAMAAAQNGAQGALAATPFTLRDPASIPPRKWLYGRHYIRRFVSATVAPGGLGKTTLTTVEALAMATGRPLLGVECEPRRVWIFNLEDPFDEIERRIAAACVHYGIRPDEIRDRLFADSGRDQPLAIAVQGPAGIVVTPHARQLTDELVRRGVDALIVDPFVQSHGVNENDNSAIALVARSWAQIANDANCAIDLSHHVRKAGAQNASIEDARGARALLDAARAARRLVRMTGDEAKHAGIDADQAWRYSREGDGKENLAPPDRTHTWRRLESVELGNGDNIGVMAPWKWPDPFSDVTVHDLLRVQLVVAAGRYRASAQSKDWVGGAVAQVLDVDLGDDAVRSKVKAILKTWTKNGAFAEFDGHDEHRHIKRYVRVGTWANEAAAL